MQISLDFLTRDLIYRICICTEYVFLPLFLEGIQILMAKVKPENFFSGALTFPPFLSASLRG